MDTRRAMLRHLAATTGAGAAAALGAQPPAAAPSATTVGDVRAFGARGDGTTDDTAAFNAATRAGAPWQAAGATIHVPAGRYRLDGTVFLRKGQALVGEGDASLIDASRAAGRTLVLGRDSADREDPGGAPASVSRLRFLGGSGTAPLISAPLQGFALRDLFLSAAGTGIEVTGADGIIANVVIDQALNGVVLRGARNLIVTGLLTYLANYALTLDEGANAVVLSDAVFAYSKNASILFAERAGGIGAIQIANAAFISSIGYPGFVGHVHARAEAFDARFTGCTFRNWREFAVIQAAGSGADLTFSNCAFDGSRSDPSYNASDTAKVVQTGAAGRFRFSDCRFGNLACEIARVGPGLRELVLEGGGITGAPSDPIRFVAPAAGRLRVRGVDGFGRSSVMGGRASLALPWSGATTAWQVTAERRGGMGGLTRALVVAMRDGEAVSCAIASPEKIGAGPALSVGFGGAPGGPARAAFRDGTGLLAVTADLPDIEWSAHSAG